MANELAAVRKSLNYALSGKGAHVEAEHIFEELEWKLAGVRMEGASHTIFQILNHLIFWQDWAVSWMKNESPPLPKHASVSWPGDPAPSDKKTWDSAVRHFHSGLRELQRLIDRTDLSAAKGRKTPLEMMQTMASHNSYHLGQAVLLRQVLHAWPPSAGGLTW